MLKGPNISVKNMLQWFLGCLPLSLQEGKEKCSYHSPSKGAVKKKHSAFRPLRVWW